MDSPFIDPRYLDHWSPKSISTQGGLRAVAESIAAIKMCPTRYVLQPGTRTSLATVMDTATNQWLIRFDQPHASHHNYHHINVNKKLTGIPDPHTPVSGAVVEGAGTATTVIKYVGIGALVIGITIDTIRVGKSMYDDHEEGGNVLRKRTIKTGVTTASGWGLGFAGAYGGAYGGASIGAFIGAFFGGVGAAPGAAIGGITGALLGGMGLGIGGSVATGAITDAVYEEIRKTKTAFIFKIEGTNHLCILLNISRKIEGSDEERAKKLATDWVDLLTNIVAYFLTLRNTSSLSLLTKRPLEQMKISPNIEPSNCRTHYIKSKCIHESEITDLNNENIRAICNSGQFCGSQIVWFNRNDDTKIQNVNNVLDFNELLKYHDQETCELPAIKNQALDTDQETYELPAIKNQALVMDVTGKAMYWLNPNKGARDTAILLERKFPCLEIIGD